jgi:Fic family protein
MARIGQYVKQTRESIEYNAFIPNEFPPRSGFDLSPALVKKANTATLFLGKLDGITRLLPDVDFFIFMYMRKDATSSSQIEGTNATMVDAIEAESKTSDTLPPDVDDILHYLKAMNFGLARLSSLPLSLRFIKELHRELLLDARKTQFADPGNFRKTQNWIGGTKPSNASYVPPPPFEMKSALHELENFFRADDDLLPITKAAIIHSQFETIHPFLDGNGRTGRLLITFYLQMAELLERPVLFLSWYFKKHQEVYYKRLNEYHSEGKVEEWVDFFLDGVIEVSKEAIETVHLITKLREEDMKKIMRMNKTASDSADKVLPELYRLPIVNVALIQEWTGFTRQGAQNVIDRFMDLGILEQKDLNKTYGRSYIYNKYLEIFNNMKSENPE